MPVVTLPSEEVRMQDAATLVGWLARMPEGPPIVSLYLDARWRDQHQRDRVRLFFHEQVRALPPDLSLKPTLDRLQEHIDALVNQDVSADVRGVALFASELRGLFEELSVDTVFRPSFHVDFRPCLHPLVEAVGLDRPALVVCIDSPSVTVLELSGGRVVEQQAVEREVPRRHAAGGWQQRKLQRSCREFIRQVWQEGARLVVQLAREDRSRAIVLLGQPPSVRAFARELPQALRERIAGTALLPYERRLVLAQALEILGEERVTREAAAVRRVLDASLSGTGGALGLEASLLAMNERRVSMLVLSRRFGARGYRCDRCEAFSVSAPGGACPFCGAAARSVELHEALVRRALADGAGVVVAGETSPLDAHRGVGALLRRRPGATRPAAELGFSPAIPSEFAHGITT